MSHDFLVFVNSPGQGIFELIQELGYFVLPVLDFVEGLIR